MDSDCSPAPVAASHILVIEDQPLVQDLVLALLTGAGYLAVAVDDADQGFALWSRSPRRFQLVITDIMMPSRLDGLTLGRLLSKYQPALPVLYMSASLNLSGTVPLVEGWNFLRKPFSPGDFLDAVARMLVGPAPVYPKVRAWHPRPHQRENPPGAGCLGRVALAPPDARNA